MDKLSYRCHRFPNIVIEQAVWLYCRFALSHRDVEDMLAERGTDPLIENFEVPRHTEMMTSLWKGT